MKKWIGRRFVSLLLTVVTVLTLLPAMTLPARAATSGTVTGLNDETIGLSFDGDAEDPWSTDGMKITGSATSVVDSNLGWAISSESTLTITNNRDTSATLSFDYTVVLSDGEIKVDNIPVPADGTFSISKELEPGGNTTVYIMSGNQNIATTITMTNVRLVSAATAEVTFRPAEHGSYTVNGKEITELTTMTQSGATAYRVAATPVDGYRFKGWYNETEGKIIDTRSTTTLNLDSNCTITAQFVSKDLALFETKGQRFTDLNEAVEEAKKSLPAIITLAEPGKITGSYTIPSDVTLLIPFDDVGTVYNESPAYDVNVYQTQSVFRKLTMAPGSSITVDGAISVGGKHSTKQHYNGPSGPYGQIDMAAGSFITLNRGAKLYAWGYITGDGQITAESGATVYEYFQVRDWRGGNATRKMITSLTNHVFPFSQYYVQNIEAPLTFQYGASEKAYISLTASDVTVSTSIDFIGSNGLFKLEPEGSIIKRYVPATGRTEYTTNGTASLDHLAVTMKAMGIPYTIDSKNYVLPINGNMTLNIASGKVTSNYDLCLLPGVQINIAKDAELEIAKDADLYVYDSEEWGGYCFPQKKLLDVNYSPTPGMYKRTEADLVDAKIDVNGTLTAAGSVYTTQSGADICSSGGTGKFIQQRAPGTATVTHQVSKQENKKVLGISSVEITYAKINITLARLKNADGGYSKTAGSKAGDTFIYCKCQDCGNGTWVKDIAAIINNGTQRDTYSTLQAAVNEYTPNSSTAPTNYIKLLHNTTEKTINVNNKSLYLDLNGRTVTGDISVTSGYKLYGMDSSTGTSYDVAPTGKIVGTVTGTVAPTYQTPGDTNDRYVAILSEENGTSTLSFHRFNISVTGYRFELKAPECALFFIGKFQGDKAAKDYLTSLGFTLTGKDGKSLGTDSCLIPENIPEMPSDGEASESKVVRTKDGAFLFEAYLMRSFDKGNRNGYTEKIKAIAQATFKNNVETQNSEPKQWSFEDAWTEPEGLNGLTPEQKTILDNFLNALGITNP